MAAVCASLALCLLVPAVARAQLPADDALPEDADRWAPKNDAWGRAVKFRYEIGAGGVAGITGGPEAYRGVFVGGSFTLGFHMVGKSRGGRVDGLLCAPYDCFMAPRMRPRDSLLGNDHALEVHLRLTHAVGREGFGPGTMVGGRFTARLSSWTRLRVQALMGTVLPELGVAFPPDRPSAVYLEWALFPVGLRVMKHFALEFDPLRIAVFFPRDHSRAWLGECATITLVVL